MALTKDQINENGISDIGDWGEKDISGAYDGPLNIGGELVDVDKLPPLSASDEMGELESTGDTGNAGDLYEGRPVPLRP